jgi:SAM-dependent methyltransferase
MSDLPSVGPLEKTPDHDWRRLGSWLRERGATPEQVAPLLDERREIPEILAIPLRHWRLANAPGALPVLLRLLCFDDRVAKPEAVDALGGEWISALLAMGLVVEDPGDALRSPFELGLWGRRYVLTDRYVAEGDKVMGAWKTTANLCRLARPTRPLERALDLGCGSGAIALELSEHAREVVATDIYPRALTFARCNAAMNGRENIEWRAGDLFEPVRGEKFDLVVCQPPFVAAPAGVSTTTYLHGGARGDEILKRVLAGLHEHLTPGGTAVVYLQWPVFGGEPLAASLREVLGPAGNLLVLRGSALDLGEFCAVHAYSALRRGWDVYASRVVGMRAHFARLGIRELLSAFVVVTPAERGWTSETGAARLSSDAGSGVALDALLRGTGLASEPTDRLLERRLQFSPEINILELSDGTFRLDAGFADPTEWPRPSFALLAALQNGGTVRSALADLRKSSLGSGSGTDELLLDTVRRALRTGVLVEGASAAPAKSGPR